jgi:hypothetical protein
MTHDFLDVHTAAVWLESRLTWVDKYTPQHVHMGCTGTACVERLGLSMFLTTCDQRHDCAPNGRSFPFEVEATDSGLARTLLCESWQALDNVDT